MQEITEKLHKRVMEEFEPMAMELARQGFDKNQIVAAFQNQLKIKTQWYYGKLHAPKAVKDIIGEVLPKNADSKAEAIFYKILNEAGIKFQFQYTIGPYKADYLFGGFLVVELDGPQHTKESDEKRDQYMRKMGYKIIRVPIWILVSDPYAVVEEIREAIKEGT